MRVPRIGSCASMLLAVLLFAAGCGGDDDVATIQYELVDVGDPGNVADSTGYGAVAYEYRIGRYEVTIGQYAEFLNAVAVSDTHGLYKPGMGASANVAGIVQSGENGSYSYSVTGPSGVTPPGAASGSDRPITFVSWFNAARFANWLANGQPRGEQDDTTTEDGAYPLHGRIAGAAVRRNAINPNTGATPTFRIPTENEWYKAAYYDAALAGGAGGYFNFATQSDALPGNVIGNQSNQANYISDTTGYSVYSVTQAFDLDIDQNYLSDVGAFSGSASYYGTFDQTGNVWEWNDLDGTAGPFRAIRGAAWTSTPPYLHATLRLGYAPDGVNSNSGFRLAGPATNGQSAAGQQSAGDELAATPEPSRAAAPQEIMASAAGAVDIDMVVVGNPGNDDDDTGFGGVSYEFRIARYDVTIGQYAAFLNAVAVDDTHALYSSSMAEDSAISGITRSGSPGAYTYTVMDNGGDSANRPITYVSWWDAARFANWLSNGQPNGGQDETTTEDGAYKLNDAVSGPAVSKNAINPNSDAPPLFYIPLEDEWYKAAYYSPARGEGAGGYYEFATQSDTAPGNVIGDAPGQANYFAGGKFSVTGEASQEPGLNYLTDVGAFTDSGGFYGTFDQNGNVWQWNDLDGSPSPSRGLRGGYWFSGSLALQASLFCNDTTSRESNDVGFRLAGPPVQ